MITDAVTAGVPASWVAGDEVFYGGDSNLRKHLRRTGLGSVLAIAKNHQITTGIGARRAVDLAVRLPPRCWKRLSAGRGSKANAGTAGPWSTPATPLPTPPPAVPDTTGC